MKSIFNFVKIHFMKKIDNYVIFYFIIIIVGYFFHFFCLEITYLLLLEVDINPVV